MDEWKLDTDQSDVLKARKRIRLVSAGPGAGKTTLIAHVGVVEAGRIKGFGKVLGLCHTNSAVSSAKRKLASISCDPVTKGKIDIRTIHSFASYCLWEFKGEAYPIAGFKSDSKEYKEACERLIERFISMLGNSNIQKKIAKEFPVVIIDELQDISDNQWTIIKLLIGNSNTLVAVGDQAQTLYVFSGASFERFSQYAMEFPDCQLFTLSTNYRSTLEIVRLSYELINQSHYIKPKKVNAKSNGPIPKVICGSAHYQLLCYIIDKIFKYKKAGVSLNDIAILTRYRDHARGLRSQLSAKAISYKIIGEDNKRDSVLIRILFALFNIVEGEENSDDWHKVLLRSDEIGKATFSKIMKWLPGRTCNTFPRRLRFTDSLKDLLDFIQLMKESTSELPIVLEMIVNYVCRLEKVNDSKNNPELATLRMHAQSSSSLKEVVDKYNDSSFPRYYSNTIGTSFPQEYITVSTIHGIKGGEFPVVFVLGGDNDFFEKHKSFSDKESIEQELHATYVAVTRAMRDLHILFPVGISAWDKAQDGPNPIRFFKQASPDSYHLEFLDD